MTLYTKQFSAIEFETDTIRCLEDSTQNTAELDVFNYGHTHTSFLRHKSFVIIPPVFTEPLTNTVIQSCVRLTALGTLYQETDIHTLHNVH